MKRLAAAEGEANDIIKAARDDRIRRIADAKHEAQDKLGLIEEEQEKLYNDQKEMVNTLVYTGCKHVCCSFFLFITTANPPSSHLQVLKHQSMGGSKEQIEAELKKEGDKEMAALAYVHTRQHAHMRQHIIYANKHIRKIITLGHTF